MVAAETERPIHDRKFSEQGYHGRYLSPRSVRTERHRYIRRYGEPHSAPLHFNADQGEAHKVLIYRKTTTFDVWRECVPKGYRRIPRL